MAFRFVFEVKVKPGFEEPFIENWREGSMPIQEYEGARAVFMNGKKTRPLAK